MRCSAKTKHGKRCKRKAIAPTDRCKQHAVVEELPDLDQIFERYEVPPDCRPLVEAYADLDRRRREATRHIDRVGPLITTDEGAVIANPSVALERQTAAELARIHREIVRSSTPAPPKAAKSQLDELAEKRKARRAGPAGTKA